ncbi:FHA domain-containing protein [Sinomonas sp. P47F7]|uniref:FHA domain-containing protein n=1 Tax=Sinomonas sp. P47F7 TaxID=3410987 RepID=UPI003BF47462
MTTAAPGDQREVTSPFARVHLASAWRTTAARAIDSVVALIAACAVGALAAAAAPTYARTGFPWFAALVGAALGLAAAAIAHGAVQARRGRSLGGQLTKTRTVDALTGLPVPWAAAIMRVARPASRPSRALFPGEPGPWQRATGRVNADLRLGRDPITPSFVAVARPLSAPAWTDPNSTAAGEEATARAAAPDAPSHAVVISFSAANTAHWFIDACAIGRNPARQPGVTSIAVPDLSRTLSKTHLWLERRGGAVYARDLDSTTGTVIEAPGQRPVTLTPHTDAQLVVGTTVRMGDHTFRLDSIGKDGA